jgi:hypothetical protein
MPTALEIVTLVTDFVVDYLPIIAGAALVGIIAWGGRKILKIGR